MGTDVLSNHKRIQVVAFTKASDECVELVDALPKSFHEYEGVFDFREVIARDDDEAARALVTKFGLFKSKDKCAELAMFPSTDDEDDDRDPIVFKPSVATIEGFAPDAVGRFFLDEARSGFGVLDRARRTGGGVEDGNHRRDAEKGWAKTRLFDVSFQACARERFRNRIISPSSIRPSSAHSRASST